MGVSRFVSNMDRSVFALVALPEEVAATLFARYSRSDRGLREELAAMLELEDDVGSIGHGGGGLERSRERAARFHEAFVVGYGHKSVGEHAVVRLGLEGVSLLAAKAIEERRIGIAFTEKSTRYVRFERDSVVVPPGLSPEHEATYRSACERLIMTYQELTAVVMAQITAEHPDVSKQAVRGKALDLLRGLLPTGVGTSLGITANATALAHLIRRLSEEPDAEMRHLADLIRTEASLVVPTLLRHTEGRPPEARSIARVVEVARGLGLVNQSVSFRRMEAHVHREDVSGHWQHDVASRILEEAGVKMVSADTLRPDHSSAVIASYLMDRGPYENFGRALEHTRFRFRIRCDYGAWRDLQRHRIVSATRPRPSMDLGYCRSYELDAYVVPGGPSRFSGWSVGDAFDEAMAEMRGAWESLRGTAAEAYAVPLASMVEYRLDANLRELAHIIELRSAPAGHPTYRFIAQRLAQEVVGQCPWMNDHLRVDMGRYDFAREARKR